MGQLLAPNMYIMGVQKGGTTYMSLLLNRNEHFYLPSCPANDKQTKEMHFWETLGITEDHVDLYTQSWMAAQQ